MGTALKVTIDETKAAAHDEILEVDVDEFQEARRDPRVLGFLEEAKRYGERLEREGRNK